MTKDKVESLEFGDICRAQSGSPARYLTDGYCVFVSSMSNDLITTKACIAEGGEERFPLPDDEDLDKALIKFDLRNEYRLLR